LLASAQSQQAPDPQAIIRRQVNLVLVDVTVADTKGGFIGGLHASDFELLDDGGEQEIIHFSQDEIPLAIALVVDVSRSMRPIIEPVRNALVRALPTLKAEDRVALFSFATACKLEIPLSNDYPAIARKVVELPTARGTNVNNALQFAAEYLHERAPSGRRVLILLSDTLSDMGNISDYQVEQKLMNFDIGLFGIRPAGELPMYYRDRHLTRVDADHMAKASGGFIMDVPHMKDFEAAMESLIKFLKARYTLGFYPHSSGTTAASREIKVRLKNTNRQKDLSHAKLHFRQRYQLPSEASAKSP
jgi:VWFA-related protein